MTRLDPAARPSTFELPRDGEQVRAGRVVALDPRLDLVEVIATMLADTRRAAGLTQRQLAAPPASATR